MTRNALNDALATAAFKFGFWLAIKRRTPTDQYNCGQFDATAEILKAMLAGARRCEAKFAGEWIRRGLEVR